MTHKVRLREMETYERKKTPWLLYLMILVALVLFATVLRIAQIGAQIETSMITATVDIKPDTISLGMKGRWITAYIELPESYDVNDINTVLLGFIPSELYPRHVGDYDDDGIPDLMVKFDANATINYIWTKIYHMNPPEGRFDDVELTVSGELDAGMSFEGNDMVRVIILED